MDTALSLRMSFDKGEKLDSSEISRLLEESQVIGKLTKDYEETPLFTIFRLVCLSEIPYCERLPYTQKLLDWCDKNLATPEGFSYTGKVDGIVPCYNALLLEAYTRLGKSDSLEVGNALNWIKHYQVFERNNETSWSYDGICKHGGCMKATPCYIGIGKTVRALITYAEYTNHRDLEVESLIEKGTSYMLKHHYYQRLSNQAPISAHITDIMFPQAYMLSLTDLVYIVNKQSLWNGERVNALKKLVRSKIGKENTIGNDYIYSHKGYKSFDGKKKSSEWNSYLFSQVIRF